MPVWRRNKRHCAIGAPPDRNDGSGQSGVIRLDLKLIDNSMLLVSGRVLESGFQFRNDEINALMAQVRYFVRRHNCPFPALWADQEKQPP